MGEVYRARDTRLDRQVAIKVVTAALSADPELRLRFEQEARAIAALNHPHICTIHDVGRHEGVDFLVMEYLDGETLAARLKKTGALPVPEALAIAMQVGDALDAAHRVGIVHRDLKPGNVMLVRAPGQTGPVAKLLDFGLATPSAPPAASRVDSSVAATIAPSMVPTRAPTASSTSGFSGTVQYMAPEQLEELPPDHRADIFAFGCVLYEMFAGRRAFEGASSMVVIANIVNTEPPPIASLEAAHPVLAHLVRRCLEKNRDRRWQNMGDVTGELRWIAAQPAPAAALPATAAPSRSRLALLGLGGALLAALAVLAAVLLMPDTFGSALGLRRASTETAFQFEVLTPPTDDAATALSPDGRQLVFVANNATGQPVLWVRTLDRVENRELPGTVGASYPFWSPDGRSVGFFADDKLKRIDVDGGTPIVLTDAPTGRGATWGPGVILFTSGVNSPILRISTSGGPVEKVTTLDAGTGPSHRLPQFLPDGQRFLFYSSLGEVETNGIYLASLDTKTKPVRVLQTNSTAVFAPPDRLLTIRQGALVSYHFDESTGRVDGEPVVIAQGFERGSAAGAFSASRNGVLAHRSATAQRRQLTWVRRNGDQIGTIGEPVTNFMGSPELSPDERSVAVFQQPTFDNDVWVFDIARQRSRRITDGPPAEAHPIWDPDGTHLVFNRQGPVRAPVEGNQAPEPLFRNAARGVALSWTRDRRYLLIRATGTKESADLIAMAIDGAMTIPVATSPYEELEGQFSPDGKAVAFVSTETGRPEIFVQSFPEGSGRVQLSSEGGNQVRWSSDGREVFYIARDGKMMSVAMPPAGSGKPPADPVALFQTHLATGTNVIGNKAQYAVARDGRFLLNAALESQSAPIIVSTRWMHAP